MTILRDCTGVPASDNLIGTFAWSEAAAPASVTTAGNVTYTAENLLRGVFKRGTNGASRADILPTAALLVAAYAAKYGSCQVGSMFEIMLVNDATAAETITLTLGSGMTSGVGGTQFSAAIGQNVTRRMIFRFTNVTAASEACVVYC